MGRREVTGKKPGADLIERRRAPPPRLAFSIEEFCEAAGISEGMFYKIRKQRQGPREMKVGTRTLITVAAANEWLLAREAASAEA
jgi:predicted DNA-binding transcriptional regulator AlpA